MLRGANIIGLTLKPNLFFWFSFSWIRLLVVSIYISLTMGYSDKGDLGIEGKVLAESGQPLVSAQVDYSILLFSIEKQINPLEQI